MMACSVMAVIDQYYALTDPPEALHYIERGDTPGRGVITVRDADNGSPGQGRDDRDPPRNTSDPELG